MQQIILYFSIGTHGPNELSLRLDQLHGPLNDPRSMSVSSFSDVQVAGRLDKARGFDDLANICISREKLCAIIEQNVKI